MDISSLVTNWNLVHFAFDLFSGIDTFNFEIDVNTLQSKVLGHLECNKRISGAIVFHDTNVKTVVSNGDQHGLEHDVGRGQGGFVGLGGLEIAQQSVMIIFFVTDSANNCWTIATFWIKFDVFGKGMKCTCDVLQFINMCQGIPNITISHEVFGDCLVSTSIFTTHKTWMFRKKILTRILFSGRFIVRVFRSRVN